VWCWFTAVFFTNLTQCCHGILQEKQFRLLGGSSSGKVVHISDSIRPKAQVCGVKATSHGLFSASLVHLVRKNNIPNIIDCHLKKGYPFLNNFWYEYFWHN